MAEQNCIFCNPDMKEFANGIKICDLPFSRLYLFKEQHYPGRCLLVSKSHAAEFYDLPQAERLGFGQDLEKVAKTIKKLFNADKMNFLSLGDGIDHLHVHIVPKIKDGPQWKEMFRFIEKTGYLSDAEYQKMIEDILKGLNE